MANCIYPAWIQHPYAGLYLSETTARHGTLCEYARDFSTLSSKQNERKSLQSYSPKQFVLVYSVCHRSTPEVMSHFVLISERKLLAGPRDLDSIVNSPVPRKQVHLCEPVFVLIRMQLLPQVWRQHGVW